MKTSLAERTLSPKFRKELEDIMHPHLHKAHTRTGQPVRDCAAKTRLDRRSSIQLFYAELKQLGYHLQTPTALKQKHINALAEYWSQKGIAARTLHSRFSVLRVLSSWMGKRDLVGDLDQYFPPDRIKRAIAATENKAWEHHGIDVPGKIREAEAMDERLGVMLQLQRHLGLRMKEAIELRPAHAILEEGDRILVSDGTKGGRPRLIPLDTPEARAAFAKARQLAATGKTGRLRWSDCSSWKKAQRRYLGYMARLGITRKGLGVTSHGLRHSYSQASYRAHTGLPTPIEGGAKGRIDREIHARAGMHVSRNLGHGRLDVTGFYYGSYGHALRGMKVVFKDGDREIIISDGSEVRP